MRFVLSYFVVILFISSIFLAAFYTPKFEDPESSNFYLESEISNDYFNFSTFRKVQKTLAPFKIFYLEADELDFMNIAYFKRVVFTSLVISHLLFILVFIMSRSITRLIYNQKKHGKRLTVVTFIKVVILNFNFG